MNPPVKLSREKEKAQKKKLKKKEAKKVRRPRAAHGQTGDAWYCNVGPSTCGLGLWRGGRGGGPAGRRWRRVEVAGVPQCLLLQDPAPELRSSGAGLTAEAMLHPERPSRRYCRPAGPSRL